MKFIHTSDWHIGRQFHNVSLLDDQAHVLDQLIEHIQKEAVDAVVIAGDIYDRSVPPATAVTLLDSVLQKICSDLNTPVIMISGNHDSAERLGFAAKQLAQSGLHILSDLNAINQPISITDKAGHTTDFYGIPYNDPEQVRHHYQSDCKTYDQAHTVLVDKIKLAMRKENSNVLISHCFIDGAQDCESERPLSIGGADRVSYQPLIDFDYVALGHLHQPQSKGAEHIRYSGSLLKYSFSEQLQNKSFTLVEITSDKKVSTVNISTLALIPLRDVRIIEDELDTILLHAKTDPKADDYLLVRLTDQHAILDAMGKLRSVYPNVLHLEKPGIMQARPTQAIGREQLKRNELEMFKDFFEQTSGNPLSKEQDQAITQVIQTLHKDQDGDDT